MRTISYLMVCSFLLSLSFLMVLQAKRHKKLAKNLEKNFLNLSNPITTRHGAFSSLRPPKLDIIFALDASLGFSKDIFEYQKNFTKALIEGFSISPSNTRVAIVSCSSNYVHFNFFLKTHVNKECLVDFIPTLRYQHQGKALGKCLQSIHWQAFVKSHDIRKEARKVLFVISTGKTPHETPRKLSVYANKLQRIGVKIFGLSIGCDNDGYKQLQGIVSHPITKHIFRVRNLNSITPLVKLLRHKGHYATNCTNNGKPLYDECGRLCYCQNGHMTNCTRIRKFFTSMSQREQFLFIIAFRTMTTRKDLKKRFRKLAHSYRKYFSRYIHTRRYFLPWHRAFLLKVENILRAVDCRVTIPYWDWTLFSANPWSKKANNVWNSFRGFGGNGIGKEMCVGSGPFRKGRWSLEKKGGSKECLRRNFKKNPKLPDALIIRLALETPKEDFEELELLLRAGFHHCVTCAIGGTMCSEDNVWSPEYLLITTFVDSLWGKWQQKSEKHWPVGFPDVSDILPGFSDYTGEVLQLSKQPGCVRVMYDDSESKLWKKMDDQWEGIRNKSHLRQTTRLRFIYTARARRLYGGLTKEEKLLTL